MAEVNSSEKILAQLNAALSQTFKIANELKEIKKIPVTLWSSRQVAHVLGISVERVRMLSENGGTLPGINVITPKSDNPDESVTHTFFEPDKVVEWLVKRSRSGLGKRLNDFGDIKNFLTLEELSYVLNVRRQSISQYMVYHKDRVPAYQENGRGKYFAVSDVRDFLDKKNNDAALERLDNVIKRINECEV